MWLGKLIEENTFLKDEISFLRDDIKRKSDVSTFLLKLLGKHETNQNIQNVYRLPESAHNNDDMSLNSTNEIAKK